MGRVTVKAIHNRTAQPVRYPTTSGGTIDITAGESLDGPCLVEYDDNLHGDIPSPNEVWFIDSVTEFAWGTVRFDGPLGL